ncbi:MAG: sulfurtransferase [Anaerolineae bacterium]
MQRKIVIVTILLAVALLALGCSSAPAVQAPAKTESGYANPAALVDTTWVVDHLDDPDVRLIDVSAREEVYNEGHLPGAVFVGWNRDLTNPNDPVKGQILSADDLSALLSRLGVEKDDTVVFYDGTSNLFAARAYWVLKYYQHPNVRVYNGGTKKWIADDQELTTSNSTFSQSKYVAGEPDPEIRTTGEYVLAHLDDQNSVLCDTRSAKEYAGVDARSARGGHIPGAINVDWVNSVNQDGTFKDAQTLRTLYEGAGFDPDKEIITYCQTGVRGAHTWFVLRELLGYPTVRNYDGSWEEWGNIAELPIER